MKLKAGFNIHLIRFVDPLQLELLEDSRKLSMKTLCSLCLTGMTLIQILVLGPALLKKCMKLESCFGEN